MSESLQTQVDAAWKEAMKARDPSKDTLSAIRTELKNKAIETRTAGDSSTTLDDKLALDVLTKMAKQRRESIAEYEKGGRDDLVEKEKAELDVITGFLPAALTSEELGAIVDDVIAQTGATSMKDMGKVMGPIMARTAGRADGKAVQAKVREKLG